MKRIVASALLFSACSEQQTPQAILATGTFSGEGRDRLCIVEGADGVQAGLIAYGAGNANCSASGRIEEQQGGLVLVPRGEGECRIPLTIAVNRVSIGNVPAACSYYCGPGATMSGKTYNRADMGAKAVDLAGDPLC